MFCLPLPPPLLRPPILCVHMSHGLVGWCVARVIMNREKHVKNLLSLSYIRFDVCRVERQTARRWYVKGVVKAVSNVFLSPFYQPASHHVLLQCRAVGKSCCRHFRLAHFAKRECKNFSFLYSFLLFFLVHVISITALFCSLCRIDGSSIETWRERKNHKPKEKKKSWIKVQ